MKKLLFFSCILSISTMAIAMNLSFDEARTCNISLLPRYIERAEWNSLVSWISRGFVIASDFVKYEKAAFDKPHVNKYEGIPRTLFQQLIYEIHMTARMVSNSEHLEQQSNIPTRPETENLKNNLQRLERGLEALIASNTINHSAELAKNALRPDEHENPGAAEAIYTKALNSVTNCQRYIGKKIDDGAIDSVAHYIAFNKIDPLFLNHLTLEQKKAVASELINWAPGNPGHYGDFARAASNILSPAQSASRFRLTLPKHTWITGVVIFGLAAIVSLYKHYSTTSEGEDDDTEPEEQEAVDVANTTLGKLV